LAYDTEIFNIMQQLVQDFINCCKINNIHKFMVRMQNNSNNVCTEKGEYIFEKTIKYELQKLLFKLDNFEKHCTNFNYTTYE